VLAYLITVSYANRLIPQALFGLDDINAMLSMYLMLGPCGAKYSIDAWLRRRGAGEGTLISPTVGANFAIRLIQVHMCVIYFFSAIGKLTGESWLGGQALWRAAGNLEYQSVDLTWLADWPLVINALTISAVLWELFYPVLGLAAADPTADACDGRFGPRRHCHFSRHANLRLGDDLRQPRLR